MARPNYHGQRETLEIIGSPLFLWPFTKSTLDRISWHSLPLQARNKFRRYIVRNRRSRRYCLSKSFDAGLHTGECTSCEIRYGEQTRFKLWSLDSGIPNYRNRVTRVSSYRKGGTACPQRSTSDRHKLHKPAIRDALNIFSLDIIE